MELYRVESLTFTYPGQFAPALRLSLIHISEPTRRS